MTQTESGGSTVILGSSSRGWIVLLLGLVAAFGAYRFFGGRLPLGSGMGRTVDYGWKLMDLKGKPVEFSSFKGRPVFLNLWATWCGPCIREMPSIQKLASDPRVKDVAFVCVALDDSVEPVRAYVERQGLTTTVLRPVREIPRAFLTNGIPATFLISHDGRIVKSELGSRNWNEPDVVSLLESLVQADSGRVTRYSWIQ